MKRMLKTLSIFIILSCMLISQGNAGFWTGINTYSNRSLGYNPGVYAGYEPETLTYMAIPGVVLTPAQLADVNSNMHEIKYANGITLSSVTPLVSTVAPIMITRHGSDLRAYSFIEGVRFDLYDGSKHAIFTEPSSGTGTMKKVYIIGDSETEIAYYGQYLNNLLGSNWRVINKGISGNTTTQMLARFHADIIAPGDAQAVVIWGGVNDARTDVSAVTIQSNLQEMYTMAHDAGIPVIALNVTPWKGYGSWSSDKQIVTETVNAWIANTAANIDYKIDAYSNLEDSGAPDTLKVEYNSGDYIHLSKAGFANIASSVYKVKEWENSPGGETLDTEAQPDPEFDNPASWTVGAPWLVTGGKCSCNSVSGLTYTYHSFPTGNGPLYKVHVECDSYTSGIWVFLADGTRSASEGAGVIVMAGYRTAELGAQGWGLGTGNNGLIATFPNISKKKVLTPDPYGVSFSGVSDAGISKNAASYTLTITRN